MQGVALPKTSAFDAELQKRVRATEPRRNYARALEWQRRAGFCSSASMRCLLNSYNAQQKQTSVGGAVVTALSHVPTPWGGPDTPEGFKAKILAALSMESKKRVLLLCPEVRLC